MPSPADPHLTIDQAAEALGTNPDHVTGLITVGYLDYTGHGNDLRIRESALIAYAINAVNPPDDAESHAAPQFSATVQSRDPHGFDGQEVAA